MPIEVVPYNPKWPDYFGEIEAYILSRLDSEYLHIEHVGSTSVAGLSAKPIIDIDIIVRKSEDKKPIISSLEFAGYEHLGDLGIMGRDAFKMKVDELLLPKHNLYLIDEMNIAWLNHKYLRDYLRINSYFRDAYSELKLALAKEHSENIDAYIDGKTDFIIHVLRKSAMSEEDLEVIEKQNKL